MHRKYMENEIRKYYTNGEITILWQPALCTHSKNCWNKYTGLLAVFNPMIRPWINMEGAATDRIIEQVKLCPSAALTFTYNAHGEQ